MSSLLSQVSRRFNAASAAARGYVFDYETEVAKLYAAAPEIMRRICFVALEGGEHQIVSPDPMTKATQDRVMRDDHKMIYWLGEFARMNGSFAFKSPHIQNYVVVNRAIRKNLPKLTGAETSSGMEAFFALQHEIAHIAAPYGYDEKNLSECIADAFACLRAIQVHGGPSPVVKALADMRAVELVFRDDRGEHFTSPVVMAIHEDSHWQDFTTLGIDETLQLAVDYAATYRPDLADLHAARNAFFGMNNQLRHIDEDDGRLMKKLLWVVESAPHVFTRTWGHAALTALAAGQTEVNGHPRFPAPVKIPSRREVLAVPGLK